MFHLIDNSFYSVLILANEALMNLRKFRKPQSIVITGISGSGKTENRKHIINFMSRTDLLHVNVTGPLIEAFGNARTRGNSNSSRFCKYVEVLFNLLICSLITPIFYSC